MNNTGWLIFPFLILAFLACDNRGNTTDLSHLIVKTGKKYVPDKRLGVWNFHLDLTGSIIRGETTSNAGLADLKHQIRSQAFGESIHWEVALLPDSLLGDSTAGIIRVSVAHLRKNPRHSMEMISQGLLGAPVDILKAVHGYYLVRMEDGYIGWMSRYAIDRMTPDVQNKWLESNLGIYREISGSIYSFPSSSGDVVSDIPMGARVQILSIRNGWVHVEMPDARTGYLPRKALYTQDEFLAIQPAAENIIHLGKQLLGVSYLWGGTSVYGLDCSGFTQTLFKMNGRLLPRDANLQVNEGTAIDTSDNFSHLCPGDLLFFGHTSDHITHVGLYIGNLEFIHESGMVKINSFDPNASNYNARRRHGLQQVKRVL